MGGKAEVVAAYCLYMAYQSACRVAFRIEALLRLLRAKARGLWASC